MKEAALIKTIIRKATILAATTIIDADFTLAARKTFISRFDKKATCKTHTL